MSKVAVLFLFAAITVAQAFPADDTAIAEAVAQQNWELAHKLINEKFNDPSIWEPALGTIPSGNVRSLKPPPGGHVYGTSEFQFHSSSNINGKTEENSAGHKVVNNDGKVEEFDFKPTI